MCYAAENSYRWSELKTITLSFALTLFFWQLSFSQGKRPNVFSGNHPGAPQGIGIPKHPTALPYRNLVNPGKISGSFYPAYFYTFNDIAVFSYFDSTNVTITTPDGNIVADIILNADSYDTLSPGNGIYFVNSNKPCAVLTGDAITSTASGYFAMDEYGNGTTTKLNTWMMGGDSGFDPHFIIFAYQSGTQFVVRDLATGDSLAGGIVDSTCYFDIPNVSSVQQKALQVISNNPVSVLSYTDQGYYVPSSDGTFAGNLFYGFSGYSSAQENSITLVSYSDSNAIVVTSLTTSDTLAVDTLNHWQVQTFGITEDTFWKVTSTGTITAANIPFEESWENTYSYYWYLAGVADSTGKNIGTSFVVPTTQSDLSIFSCDDNNSVQVIQLGGTAYPYESPVSVKDTILQSGDVYVFTSPVGNYVYRIQSSGNISVVQSSAGSGAGFMPVNNAVATGVIAVKALPTNFVLYQNFPNPFNPATTIGYQLSAGSHVTLKVYDVLGRELKTLVDEAEKPGRYDVKFNASNLSSGVYFCKINAIGSDGQVFTATKKLMLLK